MLCCLSVHCKHHRVSGAGGTRRAKTSRGSLRRTVARALPNGVGGSAWIGRGVSIARFPIVLHQLQAPLSPRALHHMRRPLARRAPSLASCRASGRVSTEVAWRRDPQPPFRRGAVGGHRADRGGHCACPAPPSRLTLLPGTLAGVAVVLAARAGRVLLRGGAAAPSGCVRSRPGRRQEHGGAGATCRRYVSHSPATGPDLPRLRVAHFGGDRCVAQERAHEAADPRRRESHGAERNA